MSTITKELSNSIKSSSTLTARFSPQRNPTTLFDSQGKQRTSSIMTTNMNNSNIIHRMLRIILHQWKGNMDFMYAQAQVILILGIAYIGNNWKDTYPREENKNYTLFWFMNTCIVVVGFATMKHIPNSRNTIQILSRSQTEEWKGWMQWAFIMVRFVCLFMKI